MAGSSSILYFDHCQHPVRCFLFKLGLFLSILFVLDLVIGLTLRHFYFTQTSGSLYNTIYAFEKSEEDVLILGSSRACRHYVPDIFEMELRMSAYNVGAYQQEILYYLAIWRALYKRHIPKVIILDISFGSFSVKKQLYDTLSVLLPYYKDHPEVRDIVESRGPFEKIKLLSQIYPFNSYCLGILMGNFEFMQFMTKGSKGYAPALNKQIEVPLQKQVLDHMNLDKNKISAFQEFLSGATKAGVKVVVAISPYYVKVEGKNSELELIIQQASNYNVPVIDYSQNAFFLKRPDLFMDSWHMNDKGAHLYSKMMAQKLNVILSLMEKNVHMDEYWDEAMDVPM